MKRRYGPPTLVIYGQVNELTNGFSGSLPDLDVQLNVVNDDCVKQTFNGYTTKFCIVAGGSA